MNVYLASDIGKHWVMSNFDLVSPDRIVQCHHGIANRGQRCSA